jgi:hypothetical protein
MKQKKAKVLGYKYYNIFQFNKIKIIILKN